jgi:hypothetical protein
MGLSANAQVLNDNDLKASAVSAKGLTGDDLPTNPGPIIFSARRTLEKGLEQMPAAANKIIFLEQLVDKALKITQKNDNQEVVEETLKRSQDIVAKILPLVGRNTDIARLVIAGLLQDMVQLAKSYAKDAPDVPCKFERYEGESISEGKLPYVNYGHYGVEIAQLFQKASKQNISLEAEAILLIRGLGYLGQDVSSDLTAMRVSNQRVQNLKSDIIEVQQSPERARIIADLTGQNPEHKKYRPNPSDVASLRSQVMNVIATAASIYP